MRTFLIESYWNCLFIGTIAMISYPLLLVPIMKVLKWYCIGSTASTATPTTTTATTTTVAASSSSSTATGTVTAVRTTKEEKREEKSHTKNTETNLANINPNNTKRLPNDYWFVIWRTSILYCFFNANQLWYLSNYSNYNNSNSSCDDSSGHRVIWNINQISIYNTLGCLIIIFIGRELLTYWYHRIAHTNKFIYKYIHWKHHATTVHNHDHHDHHDYDDHHTEVSYYDGFYGTLIEAIIINILNFIPIVLCGGIHILTVSIYLSRLVLFDVLFNHVQNYNVTISIPIPNIKNLLRVLLLSSWWLSLSSSLLKTLKATTADDENNSMIKSNNSDNDCNYINWIQIYNNRHHENHHKYRRGNYAEIFHIVDIIFDTEIKIE